MYFYQVLVLFTVPDTVYSLDAVSQPKDLKVEDLIACENPLAETLTERASH